MKVSLQDEYTKRYDSVVSGTIDLTKNGIAGNEISSPFTAALAKEDGQGGYKNHSSSFDIPYRVDSAAPEVAYQPTIIETVPVVDQLISALSFGTFSNSVYTAQFDVTDNNGSGYDADDVEVYVWKLSASDLSNGKVSEDAIKAKVDEINSSNGWVNAVLVDGKTDTFSVEVAKDASGQASVIEADYVVLAKVKDRVDNTKVYASNGIVVEVTEPVIEVTFNPANGFSSSDIDFKIKVKELDKESLGVSGISNVSWSISCDGKEVPALGGSVDLNNTSGLHTADELLVPYESDWLKIRGLDSNNIVVKVTATDRSGNTTTKEYNVYIDKSKPYIEVIYDENSPLNVKYFNKTRTATVIFHETNFDKSKATFDITLVDGTVYKGVSLETINGAIEGVKAYWESDTQENWQRKNLTSDREVTAIFVFYGDNDISDFMPHCQDLAGNWDKGVTYHGTTASGTETDFVIDKLCPVIKLTGIDEGSMPLKPVLTITDNNYNPETVYITLTGRTRGKVSLWDVAEITNYWNGQTLTFKDSFQNINDTYTLTVRAIDKAGNENLQMFTFEIRDNRLAKVSDLTSPNTMDPVDITGLIMLCLCAAFSIVFYKKNEKRFM